MRSAAAALALWLACMSGGFAAAPDPITPTTAAAVRRWVDAVRRHRPGSRDEATGHVAGLTFANRVTLNDGMALFLSALQGQRVVTNSDARKAIAELGRAIKEIPGADEFFRRAAVLHSDAALQAGIDNPEPEPAEDQDAAKATRPPPPLLTRHRFFLDKDGEIHGEVAASWNWPFARSLLDLISPSPADDPFVAVWYHATAAFMLQKGLYGEAVTHLERAGAVLPDDARVLFDRASYSEIQGLPVSQVLLSDEDLFTLQAQRAGRRPPVRTTAQGSTVLGIPLSEVANETAERLFRRALRADPSLIEARVRLARLLGVRKRHEEAAAELAAVLADAPTGPVGFYAHMFAGREAQALGRIGEAAGHYRDASVLYPGAQSARLAESQAALLAADVPGTLEPLKHLDRSSSADDPWWKYHLAAGRDADLLLREMWAKLPKS